MLVGFGTRINSQYSCYCYFSGGVAPSFIPPQGSEYHNFQHDGNGPIMKTRLSDDLNYPRDHWNCFVYAQVSKQQYFSFQPISSTLSDHNVLICIFNRSLLDL